MRTSAAAPTATQPVILIVEDDQDSRVLLRLTLEAAGCTVYSAADGRSAVDLLATLDTKPQLLLVDLDMPVMNGWQLMEYLKCHPSLARIPIAVQSADEESTLPDGVAFVVNKPLDIRALLALVKHRLRLA
jgi:CheY-like chemotaxis protein